MKVIEKENIMELPMKKYRFYTSKNKVIAVSTYAGKPVRGVAKCNPEDEFSLEDGKKLAAARCNEKISCKRLRRAMRKLAEAEDEYSAAQRRYEKMKEYLKDAQVSCLDAQNHVSVMLSKFD